MKLTTATISSIILATFFFLSIFNTQAQTCFTGTVDERAAAYLKSKGEAITLQQLMSGTITEIRKDVPTKFLTLPEVNVKRITITKDNIKVNVVNVNMEPNLLVIINFHPGGFIKPLLPSMEYEAMRLSKKFKAVVFDIDYRVAPEHKFPTPRDDAYSAYNWVIENAKAYGGDPEKIILHGTEAGANLAALVMHKARKEEKHKAIKSVLIICPMLDNPLISFYGSFEDNAKGYGFTKDQALFNTQTYLDKSIWFANSEEVWPIYESKLMGMPPTLIVTTEFDVFRDEGLAYGKKLEKAGNRVSIRCFPQQLHAFAGLPPGAAELERLYELMQEVIDFSLSR